MLEPKETLGTVITSDNAQRRLFIYRRGTMMNLHSIFFKVDANSNTLFVLLELHSYKC